jgi:hypothetical protein
LCYFFIESKRFKGDPDPHKINSNEFINSIVAAQKSTKHFLFYFRELSVCSHSKP